MANTELMDIESSMQTLVRRAYELGRNDVLKRVVDVLKTDKPAAESLALPSPQQMLPDTTEETAHAQPELAAAEVEPVRTTEKPWWAWPVR
ncbi:MAG TPA: hypothetical protein VHO91_00205 [Rhodopila sp.]|nr:hypothetical protein [Rhodopila sp.]